MNNVVPIKKNNDLSDLKMLRARDLQEIFVNTSQATFTEWVKLGLIDRYKIGGGVYYKLSDVKKMIDNCCMSKNVG